MLGSGGARRSGRPCGADNVAVVPGAQGGLYCVVQCLAGSGDEIIVPEPIYATYEGVGEEKEEDSEGCLSVPFLWGGIVPRFTTIRVQALDRSGKKVSFAASGYHARVLQHEIDHLNGLVYLDRMPDMKSLAYTVKFG